MDVPTSDPQILEDIANWRMPFGRYAGCRLINLPEPYVLWFANRGFPNGRLGQLMASLLEIKVNGLEELVRPLCIPDGRDRDGEVRAPAPQPRREAPKAEAPLAPEHERDAETPSREVRRELPELPPFLRRR